MHRWTTIPWPIDPGVVCFANFRLSSSRRGSTGVGLPGGGQVLDARSASAVHSHAQFIGSRTRAKWIHYPTPRLPTTTPGATSRGPSGTCGCSPAPSPAPSRTCARRPSPPPRPSASSRSSRTRSTAACRSWPPRSPSRVCRRTPDAGGWPRSWSAAARRPPPCRPPAGGWRSAAMLARYASAVAVEDGAVVRLFGGGVES